MFYSSFPEPSLSACWTNRWPQEVIDPFLIEAAPQNFSGNVRQIKFSYPLKKAGKEMRKEGAQQGKIIWFPKTKVTLDDFQPREPRKTLNMQHPASMHCNLLKGNGCPDLHASFFGGWFESEKPWKLDRSTTGKDSCLFQPTTVDTFMAWL